MMQLSYPACSNSAGSLGKADAMPTERRNDYCHQFYQRTHAIVLLQKTIIPVRIVDGASIVITHQRVNLAGKKLYTTNKIYYHREDKLRYIGTIPLHKKTLKELIFKLKSLSL